MTKFYLTGTEWTKLYLFFNKTRTN